MKKPIKRTQTFWIYKRFGVLRASEFPPCKGGFVPLTSLRARYIGDSSEKVDKQTALSLAVAAYEKNQKTFKIEAA